MKISSWQATYGSYHAFADLFRRIPIAVDGIQFGCHVLYHFQYFADDCLTSPLLV